MFISQKHLILGSSASKSALMEPFKNNYTNCSESRIALYLLSANLGLLFKSARNFPRQIIIILNSKKTHFFPSLNIFQLKETKHSVGESKEH